MMYAGYIKLGFIKRIHGVNGQVLAWIDWPWKTINQIKTIFVEIEHTLVPYQVTHGQVVGNQLILAFQGINDRTQAYSLKGKNLFIRKVDLPEQVLDAAPIFTWVGYQIFDQRQGELGKVDRVEEMPGQTMLVVNYLSKELMIPFHEKLIDRVDHANKQINVQLPPGFIEAIF